MTYPPPCDQLVFASPLGLCGVVARGVFAFGNILTLDDGGEACYSGALAAVNSADITTVPWGQILYYDYGYEVSTCTLTGPSLVTLDYLGVNPSFLASYNDYNGPRTPCSFEILKLQVVVPPPWFINYDTYPASGYGARIVTNSGLALTATANDPYHTAIVFCTAANRVIDLPVPDTLGQYQLVLCDGTPAPTAPPP